MKKRIFEVAGRWRWELYNNDVCVASTSIGYDTQAEAEEALGQVLSASLNEVQLLEVDA